ncbi:hypothetical protein IQ251_03010 [Saccharopolyspora sp. HNM0983]|uniref:PABS domain-containing protein n=1 Tax=Saccharopolyspora montiporae TaxID=2781240 RepID=A0A929B715_9PSEU|nr:hypothetical protein [Saccharopolyspora sp. HNM0983]MBE9373410.1 hypothetical protein [Saccharopolyspora sp. HNM0983]
MAERIARALSERGELVLLRRDDALELRVNGVFVMDTAHTATERALATATLRQVSGDGLRVLVGGLGLGFTLHEVLADPRVGEAVVAEIEPALVDWHRQGLLPDGAAALGDARVRLRVGDVADVLQVGAPFDVVLLDVDNGPGYLVYEDNAEIYRSGFLTRCRDRLAAGGVLAVWSASPAPQLREALRAVFGDCTELDIPVVLGSTETSYLLYLAERPHS